MWQKFDWKKANLSRMRSVDSNGKFRQRTGIGQRRPVEVKFFAYKGTMQEVCLRLMGKKLLVALFMEGKFASEGLQAIDGYDDMLTALADSSRRVSTQYCGR